MAATALLAEGKDQFPTPAPTEVVPQDKEGIPDTVAPIPATSSAPSLLPTDGREGKTRTSSPTKVPTETQATSPPTPGPTIVGSAAPSIAGSAAPSTAGSAAPVVPTSAPTSASNAVLKAQLELAVNINDLVGSFEDILEGFLTLAIDSTVTLIDTDVAELRFSFTVRAILNSVAVVVSTNSDADATTISENAGAILVAVDDLLAQYRKTVTSNPTGTPTVAPTAVPSTATGTRSPAGAPTGEEVARDDTENKIIDRNPTDSGKKGKKGKGRKAKKEDAKNSKKGTNKAHSKSKKGKGTADDVLTRELLDTKAPKLQNVGKVKKKVKTQEFNEGSRQLEDNRRTLTKTNGAVAGIIFAMLFVVAVAGMILSRGQRRDSINRGTLQAPPAIRPDGERTPSWDMSDLTAPGVVVDDEVEPEAIELFDEVGENGPSKIISTAPWLITGAGVEEDNKSDAWGYTSSDYHVSPASEVTPLL